MTIPLGSPSLVGTVFDQFYFYGDTTSPSPTSDLLTQIYTTNVGASALPNDYILVEGTTTADSIFVDQAVGQQFTAEWTLTFNTLPADFTKLNAEYLYLGVQDAAGAACGFYFSKAGIAYTPCVGGAVEFLPNGSEYIKEGVETVVRISGDWFSKIVYVYITEASKAATFGHTLRYVLPTIPATRCTTPAVDGMYMSALGISRTVSYTLSSVGLATKFLVPNLQPVADPGPDQAVRICSIIRLDASASRDPEGVPLSYGWWLVDAPLGSTFSSERFDGNTPVLASPPGAVFTNRFYSASFSGDVIPTGTVLLVEGAPHIIASQGVDGFGDYVQVYANLIPVGLVNVSFKLLYQSGVSTPDEVVATFYADTPGLYKFQLLVYDGVLTSEPEITVVEVSESPVARGVVPDLTFFWNYLSDFWKLVDDKERIETFWSAAAQVAASELLSLWQHDYSKSLKDIQRTFQRRWLHYDLLIQDPLFHLSTLRSVPGDVRSDATSTLVALPVGGQTVVVEIPHLNATYTITLPAGNQKISEIFSVLSGGFRSKDPRFIVALVTKNTASVAEIQISAPFPFTLTAASTLTVFSGYPLANSPPSGSDGVPVGVSTYRIDRSLQGVAVQEGDYFIIDGVSYRIIKTATDPTDEWPYQRVVVEGTFPLDTEGSWKISGYVRSKWVDFYNSLVSDGDEMVFDVVNKTTGVMTHISSVALGACELAPHDLPCDPSFLYLYTSHPETYDVFFTSVHRRRYMPLDPLVVDIPRLQELIKSTNDQAILRRNLDFFLEEYRGQRCIHFTVGLTTTTDVWELSTPPRRVWAEVTYLDNRPTIEDNFGALAGFTVENLNEVGRNVDYLSAVRGLWYSYFNGPTLRNLRIGAQILLGLPFAEEKGTIKEIRTDALATKGRILIQDKVGGIVRSYTYPKELDLEINPDTGARYTVGDSVAQFAPLVEGVEVIDYLKDPEWFHGFLNQNIFFEVEKFFSFLVRVDSAVFNLSAIMFMRSFILRIKPTYTFPRIVVRAQMTDLEVSVIDEISYNVKLSLFEGLPLLIDASKKPGMGTTPMLDDPWASRGGARSFIDGGKDGTIGKYPVFWATDTKYLAPKDVVGGKVTSTWLVDFFPPLDSIFMVDLPIYQDPVHAFAESYTKLVPSSGGAPLGDDQTVSANGTMHKLSILIDGWGPPYAGATQFNVIINKNGTDHTTVLFVVALPLIYSTDINIPVAIGDTLNVRIEAIGVDQQVDWKKVLVIIGEGTDWAYDVQLPAGTYSMYRMM